MIDGSLGPEACVITVRNGTLYTPRPVGEADIAIVGNRIAAIGTDLAMGDLTGDAIDARGLLVVPGFVDAHTHLCGAGGEGGPATRTPELHLAGFFAAGVTTAVGCLGTDGLTRTVASLLMKAKGLRREGMSCFIYTGSYQVPPPTICATISEDLCYIEEVIGVGEVALADARSSHPDAPALAKLAKTAHVAGLLGGKAGILHLHMGDEPAPFSLLYDTVALSGLPFSSFYPTHVNRNPLIFAEAVFWGKRGPLDITTGSFSAFQSVEVKPSDALAGLLRAGVPGAHITMSSDAGGSLPHFDAQGQLAGMAVGRPDSLVSELRAAVAEEGIPLETALATVTENPARILGLAGKGRLAVGADADLVLLDKDLTIRHVIARGRQVVRDGDVLVKGTFE